jgi:hypothetical protein
MSRRVLLAMSGWGKSYHGQAIMEAAASAFDSVIILDYKDEYRGLKQTEPGGFATWYAVGPRQMKWSVSSWRAFLESNPKVILVKHQLSSEKWRDVCSRIIAAGRQLAGAKNATLIAVDEAHVVAPQSGKVPEPTSNLATTGRGEGASSLWMDQRPAMLEKDVLTQADETLVGGFMRTQDRKALDAEYPEEVHDPTAGEVPGLPDPLEAPDAGKVALRKFSDDTGSTIGSEWIYADDEGTMERRNTRNMSMESTHYGPEGHDIPDPEY